MPADAAPIDLYFWPTPNGWKASIALHELDLPYDLHLIDIGKGEQFEPDFLEISPNNRMPAIVDPDGPDGAPIAIFESGAILQYLARKTGNAGRRDRARPHLRGPMADVADGRRRADGRTGASFSSNTPPRWTRRRTCPTPRTVIANEVARLYGVLDRQLAKTIAIVASDDFSRSPIFAIWPWASLWEGQQQSLDDKPNLARWLDEVGARPGVHGGPRAPRRTSRRPPRTARAQRTTCSAAKG